MPVPRPADPHLQQAQARLAATLIGYASGVSASGILAERKGGPPCCAARQLVMYLLHQAFHMSQGHIAATVGRDRSTVAHAMRAVEARRDDDPAFDAWVAALDETLRAAPQAPVRDHAEAL